MLKGDKGVIKGERVVKKRGKGCTKKGGDGNKERDVRWLKRG